MAFNKYDTDNSSSTLNRKCITQSNDECEFEPVKGNPDEECINCILDDILSVQQGELRDLWIGLYKEGLMKLNCAKTGKSYMINPDFFDNIFKNNGRLFKV